MVLEDIMCIIYFLTYEAVTLFGRSFQIISTKIDYALQKLHFSEIMPHNAYATTHASLHGIDLGSSPFAHHYWGNHFVFFSWHYWDVSVHVVRFFILYIRIKILRVCRSGFPHSEIFGSKLDWQLPEAYGSLPPPSSPLDAKASTKCPFQLITKLELFLT
jgi:hypothetical protein